MDDPRLYSQSDEQLEAQQTENYQSLKQQMNIGALRPRTFKHRKSAIIKLALVALFKIKYSFEF